MSYNDNLKYEQDRAEASKYELFIKDLFLNEHFIKLDLFESREFQHKVGETLQGFEIKYDKRFAETGNLFIEVAHKKTNGDWYDSGIFKNDNSWLYVMGDYQYVYVFSKRHLKNLYEKSKESLKVKEVVSDINTSKGFLLTADLIERYYLNKITF